MLSDAPVHPTIPVTDIERARGFYTKQLGLELEDETEGHLMFRCGGNTQLTVFERATASSGEHTMCSFEVDDIEEVVDFLQGQGAEFQTFPDMPDTRVEGPIHHFAGFASVWVADPDGNLIAISAETEE